MPGESPQMWDRLFAALRNISHEVSKVDGNLSALREQLSLVQGRLDGIEEAVMWEEDEDDESSEDTEDRAFIDDDSAMSEEVSTTSEDPQSADDDYKTEAGGTTTSDDSIRSEA